MEMTERCKLRRHILVGFDRAIRLGDCPAIEEICRSLQEGDETTAAGLGYELYQRATDHGSTAAISILAAHAVPGFSDGFFYAVSLGKRNILRTFIDSADPKVDQTGLIFSSNGCFLQSVTPLMVASAKNDLYITKELLDNGHQLPELACLLNRCRSHYGRAATLVYWNKATSSESYILLTSDDPMTVTFDRQQEWDGIDIGHYPDLAEEMEAIEKRKGLLARDLLEKTMTKEEAVNLLDTALLEETKEDSCLHPSSDYARINHSPCLQYHEFVGARRFQEYINDVWYHADRTNWRTISGLRSFALSTFVCLIAPLLSIVYLIWPSHKVKELLKGGHMRFLLHLSSDIAFALLLISTVVDVRLFDIVDEEHSLDSNILRSEIYFLYKSVRINIKKILIILWIFGMAGRRAQIIWSCRNTPTTLLWHLWDGLQISLYLVFVIALFIANSKARLKEWGMTNDAANVTEPPTTTEPPYADPDKTTNIYAEDTGIIGRRDQPFWTDDEVFHFADKNRFIWASAHPVYISVGAFSVATIMTFLRLLHLTVFVRFIGPLKISLGGMFVQNVKFLTIFSFVWISFSMGLCQLYRSFEVIELYECLQLPGDPDCSDILAFANLYNAMSSLFWSLFDLLDLTLFEIDSEHFSGIQALGFFLYGFYMVMSVIILLNALIAMMSNHYTRIEENAEMEWRFARTELMIHFINHMPTVPPPLNLVWPIFRGLHLGIQRVTRRDSNAEDRESGGGDCHCKEVYKETVNKVRIRLLQERYIELEGRERTSRKIDRLEESLQELRLLFREREGSPESGDKESITKKFSPSEPDGKTAGKTNSDRGI